jgi:uncharacterized membrane protein
MATALAREHEPPTNVGDIERVGSTIAGVALLVSGLTHRSLAGRGAAVLGSALVARGVTGRCPVYERMGRPLQSYRRPVRLEEALVVAVTPHEAYRAWRDLERLPRFMKHLASVTVDGDRSHWTAEFSGLPKVEWDAEIVKDEPGRALSWRSIADGAPLENSGSVTFFDLGARGTGLRVEIGYYPPAGPLGRAVARLFSPVSEQQVREDIRRFKRLVETGEIPTTEGQPSGQPDRKLARR